MKKLLLSLLLTTSAIAANFSEPDRRHFENQCKDLMSDVMITLNEKHPNPKTTKLYTDWDLAAFAFSPTTLVSAVNKSALKNRSRFSALPDWN